MQVIFDKILNVLREADVTVVGGITYGGAVGGGSLNGIFYEDGSGNFVNEPGTANNIFGELNDGADTITLGDSSAGIYFAGAASAGLGPVYGLGIDIPSDLYTLGNPVGSYLLLDSGSAVVAIGYLAAYSNSGSYLVALGYEAANGNTTYGLSAIGYLAGLDNQGHDVNSIGGRAGQSNTGVFSNFLGIQAGFMNTGDETNSIGSYAAQWNSGTYVNGFGWGAAVSNEGDYVNALGYQALRSNTGTNVIGMGENAGFGNTISGAFIIGNSELPSYANYAAASAAISPTGIAGNTYLYYDQSTNMVGGVRL